MSFKSFCHPWSAGSRRCSARVPSAAVFQVGRGTGLAVWSRRWCLQLWGNEKHLSLPEYRLGLRASILGSSRACFFHPLRVGSFMKYSETSFALFATAGRLAAFVRVWDNFWDSFLWDFGPISKCRPRKTQVNFPHKLYMENAIKRAIFVQNWQKSW